MTLSFQLDLDSKYYGQRSNLHTHDWMHNLDH